MYNFVNFNPLFGHKDIIVYIEINIRLNLLLAKYIFSVFEQCLVIDI